MKIQHRAMALTQSLMLPVLAVALLAFFTLGAVMVSSKDRAIVWLQGTPAQLQEAQRRVLANPWFKHGRTRQASEANPLPAECRRGAHEFSFGMLGEFEGQAAREILELIASESGASVCVTNVFIINELPEPESQTWVQKAASVILGASILPLAMVLFVFVALSGRLRLETLRVSTSQLPGTLAWGVGVGVGLSVALALAHAVDSATGITAQAMPAMTIASVGLPLAFTLMVAVPAIEELAFRGWMIPLAERGVGSAGAALASSVLYAAANLPADVASAAGYFLLGATYAGLYLRTRSVLACVLANILASATSFWLA